MFYYVLKDNGLYHRLHEATSFIEFLKIKTMHLLHNETKSHVLNEVCLCNLSPIRPMLRGWFKVKSCYFVTMSRFQQNIW